MIAHGATAGLVPWLLIGATFVLALLAFEHTVVKHGRAALTPRRVARPVVTGAVVATLVLGFGPVDLRTVGAGQATDGLPDLISDPPRPGFLKEIIDETQSARLVLTFDGYVHNIGDGPLQVVGNPQIPGGMVQQVREGGEWRDVGTPTVRYETDDGHNHFHLIEAVDYVLWDGLQDAQTAVGSKIGFCLVDSEQIEPGSDQAYSEELDNFCEEDNPSATSLRMGISPGWRDIYDATTTLQWVDVSELAPGRYWIGAITDPNGEIVESDEDNNDLIFSSRPAIVPGWSPREATVERDGDGYRIELAAEAFGTVGAAHWRIEEGPRNGRLDVPTGASVLEPVLQYRAAPGFTGTDRIVVSVSDRLSAYPLTPPTIEIEIEVSEPGPEAPSIGTPPAVFPETTFFEMPVGERFETEVVVSAGTGAEPRLYGVNLPPGLAIEGTSLVGTPLRDGFGDISLVVVDETGARGEQTVTLIVNPTAEAGIVSAGNRTSGLRESVRERLGSNLLGAEFEVEGLPPGLEIDETAPIVSGIPTEVGSYDVVVRQVASDGTVIEVDFTWTVRPAIAIGFPL
ncbi:MAG: lysyl oxidase family protein [Actinomycetota bacterium]